MVIFVALPAMPFTAQYARQSVPGETIRDMCSGHTRVSTRARNPHSQLDALAAAGCERVFVDKAPASWPADPSGTS